MAVSCDCGAHERLVVLSDGAEEFSLTEQSVASVAELLGTVHVCRLVEAHVFEHRFDRFVRDISKVYAVGL